MIHYITPGNSNLNLGKEINDFVRLIPDQDWVCLRDIDTMPAYHEVFFEICEDLIKSDFDLISCMTNRLGLPYQLHKGVLDNNTDWMYHRKIGKQRYEDFSTEIFETKETVAGLFMLFPKYTWDYVGGFKEGGIAVDDCFIDWHFSVAVRNLKLKTGIAQGLYLIHMYRPDAGKDTRHATTHLRK